MASFQRLHQLAEQIDAHYALSSHFTHAIIVASISGGRRATTDTQNTLAETRSSNGAVRNVCANAIASVCVVLSLPFGPFYPVLLLHSNFSSAFPLNLLLFCEQHSPFCKHCRAKKNFPTLQHKEQGRIVPTTYAKPTIRETTIREHGKT